MFDLIRRQLLRFLRVPPEPEPPYGAPGSTRVFRAGRNYAKLLFVRWSLGQLGAAIGLVFSIGALAWFRGDVEIARTANARPPAVVVAPAVPPAIADPDASASSSTKEMRPNRADRAGARKKIASRFPDWGMSALVVMEGIGILLFLAQIPVTLLAVRLNFEQHWYVVTDRSLRIRTGIFNVHESTMSFANLQQVVVSQGPLQRLLGLADVRVQSAGGDGGDEHKSGGAASLHTGVFRGVVNAHEIRDLILARLRHFRHAGLGDPEDEAGAPPSNGVTGASATAAYHARDLASANVPATALAAANELLVEARAFRGIL